MKERILAFGDIHGCYKAAKKAIEILKDIKGKGIFLGDYVDRGPSGIKTLQLLIEANHNFPHWIFLRGNHDQMLLDLIEKEAKVQDFGKVLGMNFKYQQSEKTYREYQELDISGQQEVKQFLINTKTYYEIDDFIFLHAVLRNTSESIAEKSKDELMFNYDYNPAWNGKKFIHGHRLVEEPKVNGKGTNLNTECGYGGVLTGALLSSDQSTIDKFFHISEDGKLLN
mgnify:CR=1 FL=1